jgi:hypothetical protein
LPPIQSDQLLGEWNGGFFDTGHPVADILRKINWTGKSFRSRNDVDPVIVLKDGKRVSWGEWGMASVSAPRSVLRWTIVYYRLTEMHWQVHDMVFRGVLSTTMIYDDRPVLDHFRYVDNDFVAGIMEGKALGKDGEFHFYLKRCL